MSDDFQLRALLDLRRAERDDASAALARATGELTSARQELERRELRREELRAKIRSARAVDIGKPVLELQRNADYVTALEIELADVDETIDEQREVVQARTAAVDQAQTSLAEREAALEAVATRKRAWEAERAAERQRRAEAEMDDVALRRWHDDRSDHD